MDCNKAAAPDRLRLQLKTGLIHNLCKTGCITALQRDELLRRLHSGAPAR